MPSLLCCVRGRRGKRSTRSKKHGEIYIRKVPLADEEMTMYKENQNASLLGRPAEMTALEVELDDGQIQDDGYTVGYARILKTPQKERRVRLRPTEKENEEEEETKEGETEEEEQEKAAQPRLLSVHQSMAMIATVQPPPFKRTVAEERNNSSRSGGGMAAAGGGGGGGLRIEDVTNDPRYADSEEWEEGALVEYCRSRVVPPQAVLKQPATVVRRPSSAVRLPNPAKWLNGKWTAATAANGNGGAHYHQQQQQPRRNTTAGTGAGTMTSGGKTLAHNQQANKLVSGGSSGSSSARWRSGSSAIPTGLDSSRNNSPADSPANGRKAGGGNSFFSFGGGRKISGISQQQRPPMAHVIDVEAGQPCSRMAQCNCYGFRPHPWRKVCVHCKCDRSEHELGPSQQALSVYQRLGLKPSATAGEMAKVMQQQQRKQSAAQSQQNNNSSEMAAVGTAGHGYAWVPPGISRIKVEEYMAQLPNHMIPRLNSIGEKNREKQLMVQLPRQDLSMAYCKHLKSPQERRLYEEFVNARNEVALDIGFVSSGVAKAMECRKCRGLMERGEMAVLAPKLGEQTGWHAACFSCATCEQLLVDLTYCVRDDKVYCERHFAELHKPRCSACDELIFAGEYTKAMNKDWHSDHFCCWQCDGQLTGQRYILRDEHPYCIKCYEEIFANVCDECQKHIGIDSKDLSYKDKHWHEDCFLCSMCKVSLVDKPFGSKNERIFCSNCYDQAFATRCDGCSEIFKAGMKKMEYKGKQWHDKCFVCALCKAPIGTRSFIPKNEDVYCATCYEEKFATRCCKCKKVISTGGVTYKNEPWHRECFCCTNCNSSLAGQRFTSKDEKPYCADCYGELFAKRCSACVKPITGIGGAKFISFEDRHWHNDCFVCSQCSLSLVGKGFITDGADILCAECAKARLMAANS